MKKVGKIGLFLLCGGAVLTSLALYAKANNDPFSFSSKPIVFSSVQGRQWVEECVKLHPEILWLADSDVRKTEEGQATLQGAYSEQLFGQKYIEFDRTILSLYCLKLILDGSESAYLTFTAAQPENSKLSREGFYVLHSQGKQLLQSQLYGLSESEMALTMETALVLADMGKSPRAREKFASYGIATVPDHDDFYGEAVQVLAKHPQLCRSFSRLSPFAKQLLIDVANLVHYGHFTHLEGGAWVLSQLASNPVLRTNPDAVFFDLFIHSCDVAGALGHVNNASSLVYTEPAHRAMQAVRYAIGILLGPHCKTEWDAYYDYLKTRASWLGLNPEDRFNRVLTRIGAMLRLFTPEEGAALRKAMLELDASMRDRIVAQLDVHPQDKMQRTPTYIPAVLVNLSNNPELGGSKEERLSKAIAIGLPFLTRVLEGHKEQLAHHAIDPNIPLNFNEIAGVAKTSPHLLSSAFSIDPEGSVHLVSNH